MAVRALRFAFLAFLVLGASPARSEVIKNGVYRFTLNKPDGWHDISSKTLGDNSKPIASESATSIAQAAGAAVVAFSKYKEPTNELNSSFIMLGARVGATAIQSVPPARVMDSMLAKVVQTGAKISIVSPSRATTVGGLPAAHSRIHLDATHQQRLYQSEMDMWVIRRGDSFLVIQIQAKRNDKAAGMGQLRSAVQSIRFER